MIHDSILPYDRLYTQSYNYHFKNKCSPSFYPILFSVSIPLFTLSHAAAQNDAAVLSISPCIFQTHMTVPPPVLSSDAETGQDIFQYPARSSRFLSYVTCFCCPSAPAIPSFS